MSKNAKTFAAGLAGGLAKGYMLNKLLEKEAELKALRKGKTPEAAPTAAPAAPPAEPAAMPTAGAEPAVTSPVPDQSIEVTELPPMPEVAPAESTVVAEAADFSDAWTNDFPPPDMPVEPFVSAVG